MSALIDSLQAEADGTREAYKRIVEAKDAVIAALKRENLALVDLLQEARARADKAEEASRLRFFPKGAA